MIIYNYIKQAIEALKADVNLYVYNELRAQVNELEYDKPTIIIFPNWRTPTTLTPTNQINKSAVYNIEFRAPDHFDNSDYLETDSKAYDESSVEVIERMETLANSLMYYIANLDSETLLPGLRWTEEPILREGNGTMSGVKLSITMPYRGATVCSYE